MDFGTDYRQKREDAIKAREQVYLKQMNSEDDVLAYVLQPDGSMARVRANDRSALQQNQQVLKALRAEQVAQEYGHTTGLIHSASGGNRRLTSDMIEVITSERASSQSSTPPFSPSSSGVTGSLPMSPPMTPPRQSRPNIPPPRYTPRTAPQATRFDISINNSKPPRDGNNYFIPPRQESITINRSNTPPNQLYTGSRPGLIDSDPRTQSRTVLQTINAPQQQARENSHQYKSQISQDSPSLDINSPFVVFSNNHQVPTANPKVYQRLNTETSSRIGSSTSRYESRALPQSHGAAETTTTNQPSDFPEIRQRPRVRARSQPRLRTARSRQEMGLGENNDSWIRPDNSWMREDKSKVLPPKNSIDDDDYVYLESQKMQRMPSMELIKSTELSKKNSLKIVSRSTGRVLQSHNDPNQAGFSSPAAMQQRGRAAERADSSLISRGRRGRSVEPKMTRQKVNIESYQREEASPRTLPKPINRNACYNPRKVGYTDL